MKILILALALFGGLGGIYFFSELKSAPASEESRRQAILTESQREWLCRVDDRVGAPVVWSKDFSLAVIHVDWAASDHAYQFWCYKEDEGGNMSLFAKYVIWTDFLHIGEVMVEKDKLVVHLSDEGSHNSSGNTQIIHQFPYVNEYAKIAFFRKRISADFDASGAMPDEEFKSVPDLK